MGFFDSGIGQPIGYGISKAQLGDSFNSSKKWAKRSPSYTAIGLKRAGINRILAAGGGIGATNAQSALKANSAGSGSGGMGVGDVGEIRRTNTARGLLKSQTDLVNSQQALIDAQTREANRVADFNAGPTGAAIYEDRMRNDSLPDSPSGILYKGLREMFSPNDAKSQQRGSPENPWRRIPDEWNMKK